MNLRIVRGLGALVPVVVSMALSGCGEPEQIDVNMTPVEKEAWEQEDMQQQRQLNDS